MPETIFVTGATGTVGSRVVKQLLKRAEGMAEKPRIVAGVHSADKAQALSAAGAHIAEIDYDKPGTVEQAFGRIDKLFLVTPPDLNTARDNQMAVAAAEASGVKYIVKLSAFGSEVEPGTSLAHLHRSAELLIMASGADWTFLRPNAFMQNIQQFAGSIKAGGAISLPLGDAPVSYVDADDIAAVAVEMLLGTEIEHSGRAYDLTGPAAITGKEMAATLSYVLGKPVEYHSVSDEEAHQAMTSQGISDPQARALIELYQSYRQGYASAVSNAVGSITGRAARSFEMYAMDNKSVYAD